MICKLETYTIQRFSNRLICPKCKYYKENKKDRTLKFTKLSNMLWCSHCYRFSSRMEMEQLKRQMGWVY